MKRIVIALIFFPMLLSAQIVSFDFEEWMAVENYETPIDWMTSQDTSFRRIIKSDDSSSGNFAMKFEANVTSGFLGCDTRAQTDFRIQDPSSFFLQLDFDVKVIPQSVIDEPYFFVELYVYKEEVQIDRIIWKPDTPILDYKSISLDIPYSNIDSVAIRITGGAIPTALDGCALNTEAWIDNIVLKEGMLSNSIEEEVGKFYVSPNPTYGIINLQGDYAQFDKYFINDMSGKVVSSGNLKGNVIDFEEKGIFIINLIGQNRQAHFKIIAL